MAIPQSGSNQNREGSGPDAATPKYPNESVPGSEPAPAVTPTAPAQTTAAPVPPKVDTPATEDISEAPDTPAAPVAPPADSMSKPKDEYKIEDAPKETPPSVVDLDKEMAIPKEEVNAGSADPVTNSKPEVESPPDPNVALNANAKEGDMEPVSMSGQPTVSTPTKPVMAQSSSPTQDMGESNKIASPKDTSTEKATMSELPDLAPEGSAGTAPQMSNEQLNDTKETVHETPNLEKLEDVMATPTEGESMTKDDKAAAIMADAPGDPGNPEKNMKNQKTKSGGSSMVMKLVLIFLLLGILAMSAVLAYLLFA